MERAASTKQLPPKGVPDNNQYNLKLLEGADGNLELLKTRVIVWLGKSLDDIAGYSFALYLKGDIEYPQARFLFSDQMILYTIKLMEYISLRYPKLWSEGRYQIITEYDAYCKEAMEFLMKKYPLKEGGSVEPELFKLIPTVDKSEDMTFDMLHLAGITFNGQNTQNISKQIKQTLNYFMQLSKAKSTEFRKDMTELFTLKNEKGEDYELYNQVGMKFSENVEQYTENEVNEKGIKIKGPQVLRVIIKWIEGLENRCKEVEKYYINRYYPFMSVDNKETKLPLKARDALASNIRRQFEQVRKEDKKTVERVNTILFDLFDFIRIQKQNFRYIEEKQVETGLFTHILAESISSIAAQYLQKLIYHMSSSDKTLKLVTFNVSDLLRCKCVGNKFQIREIFDRLVKKFTVVRVKNRLALSTHDFLVNFNYKGILCEMQLGLAQKKKEENHKQECYGHFSHFIYELSRSKFSAVTEAAIINNHLNPMIVYFRGKISQRRKRLGAPPTVKTQLKINYFAGRVTVEGFEPRENTTPQFCNYCSQFKPAYNSFLEMFENMKIGKKICGQCYIQQLKPQERAQFLIGDLSEFFEEVDVKYLDEFINFEEYYVLVIFKTFKKKIQALHKPKGIDEFCDVFARYQNDQKYVFYDRKGLKEKIFFVFRLRKELRVFKDFKEMFSELKELPSVVQSMNLLLLDIKEELVYVQTDQKLLVLNNECTNQIKRERNNMMKMTTLADKDWWVMENENIDEAFFENRRIKNLLIRINKLEISDNQIKQLGFLAKNQLSYLDVSGNQIAAIDLRDFDFSQLKYLNISKNLIQNIKLYDCNLGKLETFYAYHNKLTLFDFCTVKVPNLKTLHLDNNRISRLENFQSTALPELEVLHLEENQLTDTQFLYNKRLQKIMLLRIGINQSYSENNKILSMEGLYSAEMPAIVELSIGCMGTLDLKNWNKAKLPNLERLQIRNGNGDAIEGLRNLGKIYNLKKVRLEENKFDKKLEFSDLHLKYLEELTITNNALKQIDSLRKVVLPTLKTLNFRKNLLDEFDFGGLIFAELTVINLESNQIKSIPGLNSSNLPQLTTLNLNSNQLEIVDLKNVVLPRLKTLNLSDNFITRVLGLWIDKRDDGFNTQEAQATRCKLNALENLLLNKNQLTFFSLAGIVLPRLVRLDLQQNHLVKVEGPNALTHLNMLELLNLSDNEMVTINLAELNLKNLAQLSLIGNKLTSIHCIPPTTFPSLLYLNISKNALTDIKFKDYTMPVLQQLVIAANNLVSIELPGTRVHGGQEEQQHFPQLKTLRLSQNQLQYLKLNNFMLPNLETLEFDTNLITKIEGFSQANLKKLKSLSLQNNKLAEINLNNSQLISLNYLDLRQNSLQKIVGMETLRNLLSIDMNDNVISEVAWGQASLENVRTISLTNNRLKVFDAFSPGVKWRDLISINLTRNQIKQLQFDNLKLTMLKSIVVEFNEIQRVSLSGCIFTELTLINLSNNQIRKFEGLSKATLPKLEMLNLENNQLDTFSIKDVKLEALHTLNLHTNLLTSLELQDAKLPLLKYLYASNNRLTTISMKGVRLESLQIIKLENCRLTSLEGFDSCQLPMLKELHLTQNRGLKQLKISSKCDMLDILSLRGNGFQNLKKLAINELINLRHLILADNPLRTIQFEEFKFGCLEFLDMSSSKIIEVSLLASARMPNLFELNLENNEIRSIDLSGVVMHRLKMLNLSKNHLEIIVGLNNASFPNLEILNLSDNYLEALDFNGCRIPSIEQFVFSNNLELRTVRLGEMYLPKLRNILAYNNEVFDEMSLPEGYRHLIDRNRRSR